MRCIHYKFCAGCEWKRLNFLVEDVEVIGNSFQYEEEITRQKNILVITQTKFGSSKELWWKTRINWHMLEERHCFINQVWINLRFANKTQLCRCEWKIIWKKFTEVSSNLLKLILTKTDGPFITMRFVYFKAIKRPKTVIYPDETWGNYILTNLNYRLYNL